MNINSKNLTDKSLSPYIGPITSPYYIKLKPGYSYIIYLYAYSSGVYSDPILSNKITIAGNPNNPKPIANICFREGTPVKTDQGIIAIDKIDVKKHTIQNKKITAITQCILNDDYIVCIQKNSLGKQIPSDDIYLTKSHKVYFDGKMRKVEDLINRKNIFKVDYHKEIVYNILMKNQTLIQINNLHCETLNPNNMLAKLYKLGEKKQSMIINMMNEALKNEDYKEYKNCTKLLKLL